jgi:hypothetical protein
MRIDRFKVRMARPCGMAIVLLGMAGPTTAAETSELAEQVREAVRRSIPPMEASAAEYLQQRQCFSCHHQAVPVLALDAARKLEFAIDEVNFRQQIERTREHLERGSEDYLAGRGQGGRADTAGWALWTLEVAGHPPDEVTRPVAEYLLSWQSEMGHWSPPSNRPPTEASPFTSTYVGLRGISYFAPDERHEERDRRLEKVRAWLREAEATETEDQVFQLRGLHYLGEDPQHILAARDRLLGQQRPDGGWAQTSDLASDVYATATVLAALRDAGDVSADHPQFERGLRFLLGAQKADGTWHVATRSKPIQVYFESGFPFGKDQFLSMAATAWATYALLGALREGESYVGPPSTMGTMKAR